MEFETEKDVLDWYEAQQRVVTQEFMASINWGEVSKHPLDPAFFPVLIYMRDVERLTEVYYDQLRRTPTGRDKVMKKFMQRWSCEETDHGDLLHRFLGEIGYPVEDKWYTKIKSEIPKAYRFRTWMTPLVTNWFGESFSAVHMTWGAMQEYTTLCGYQRMWQLAKHPVLETILRAIAKEEAMHSYFYWNIAKFKLQKSKFSQRLTRTMIDRYWRPVGEGLRRTAKTNHVLRQLFQGEEGLEIVDRKINDRLERLPGQGGLKTITRKIAQGIQPLSYQSLSY